MPPDFFTSQSNAQFNASVSQPTAPRHDPSATQPMNPQQDASAVQPNVHNTWSPQMAHIGATADDPTAASRDLAPTQISFGDFDFTVSSSRRD